MKRRFGFLLSSSMVASTVAACGGSTSSPGGEGASDAGAVETSVDAAPSGDGSSAVDSSDSASDGATDIDSGDGTPTRQPCTGNLGTALDTEFGRLDGYIVSIVDVGDSKMTCNGDDSHVHLQVMMNGGIYDVAVNVDGMFYEMDMPLPTPAWSEGWHYGTIFNDYATLGVHSTQFTMLGIPMTAAKVEAELANANHISVYGTGYGATGMHDTHYEGQMTDGMIVMNPQTPTASHILFFDFAGDTF
jgi:hypothetical protein